MVSSEDLYDAPEKTVAMIAARVGLEPHAYNSSEIFSRPQCNKSADDYFTSEDRRLLARWYDEANNKLSCFLQPESAVNATALCSWLRGGSDDG